jgi:hypothetical protein
MKEDANTRGRIPMKVVIPPSITAPPTSSSAEIILYMNGSGEETGIRGNMKW